MRSLIQRNRFGQAVKHQKYKLYHEPNHILLPFDGPKVLTVHDLSWIHFPDAHPVERVKLLNRSFEKSIANADKIITDSMFVKKELFEIFGIEADKVHHINLGFSDEFKVYDKILLQSVLESYGLDFQKYFVSVGTLEPRKNIETILDAYDNLNAGHRKNTKLLIVGPHGWRADSTQRRIQSLQESGNIIHLNYVPRTTLAKLISGSICLVYPSIYEGFGLPVLEAMACGIPVITSEKSSMPEVSGEAGLLVDPQDYMQISKWMELLYSDSDFREEKSKASLKQSQNFSWDKCVRETIEVYNRAIQL